MNNHRNLKESLEERSRDDDKGRGEKRGWVEYNPINSAKERLNQKKPRPKNHRVNNLAELEQRLCKVSHTPDQQRIVTKHLRKGAG